MSSLPSDLPKLPKWPFFLFDAVLLATAFAIAWNHPRQLDGMPLYAVSACVMLAAIMCAVPLLFDYTRSQDEALDERQRALESLSRTVSASAEQIGIAAQGLYEIAENTNRCLKQAEHLPQKIQEKVAEFQARIDASRDEEIEDLEREVASLRSSEGEKLEGASDKIHKAAVELAKLETAATKHLAAATEAISKAETLAEKAANRFSQAADESAVRVGTALAHTIASAQESAKSALSGEQERALAAISAKIDSTLKALDTRSTHAADTIDQKIALLEAVVANLKAAVAEVSRFQIPTVSDVSGHESPAQAAPEETPAAKRTRKARRSESSASSAAQGEETASIAPPAAVDAPAPEPAKESNFVPSASQASEALEKAPVAEATATDESPVVPAAEDFNPPPAGEGGDYSQVSPDEGAAVAAVSADGATRLIVTAYIGIGNRLYIRGEGPGLSWEKGMPLQFVSIGKWRWESADATAPVRIKLLKNDQIECPTLGELTLAPGHQAEVAATF
ncbi:MAG: hypothetical protein WC378_16250 [Opitutaceae bacterium]|jgi:uncharacterized protein YoxC